MAPAIDDPARIAKRLRDHLRGTLDLFRFLHDAGMHAQARAVWDGMGPGIEAYCNLIEPPEPPPPGEANRPADDKSAPSEGDERQRIRRDKAYEATTGPPRHKRQRRAWESAPVGPRGAKSFTVTPRKYVFCGSSARESARAMRALARRAGA